YILLVSFNIIIAIIAIKFKGLPSSPLFYINNIPKFLR
ncbi:hypothetical protein cco79_10164, partial [Campylobacter coli LMG 23344]